MQQRITDLEVRVAYLEKAHDELSEVVRELYQKLDGLIAKQREVAQTAAGAPEAEPPQSLEDEKPPHY